jgi:mannose/fructose/N-acetylgalactosamine-specific phosphotransferase system component IIB
MITGSTNVGDSDWAKYDNDLSGIIALCEALPGLQKPISLDLSDCGLSVKGVTEIAKATSAGAAVNSLTLDSNGIFGKLPDEYGRYAEPDKFAADCDAFLTALKDSQITTVSLQNTGIGPVALWTLATSLPAAVERVILKSNHITDSKYERGILKYDLDMSGFTTFCEALPAAKTLRFLDLSECRLSVKAVNAIAKAVSAGAAIEKVNVGGCHVTQEAKAQLLTAASEASHARLRAHQVLAFSKTAHARLGAECHMEAVDEDVWRQVAECVRERYGHEAMCSRLAQADQTWFEVTVEGWGEDTTGITSLRDCCKQR